MNGDFEKLAESRRSCRSYNPDKKVSKEVLDKIVDVALLAPSACNSQPWFIHYTNKPELCEVIASATQNLGFNRFTSDCTAFAVISETKPNLKESAGAKLTGRDFVGNDIGLVTAYLTFAAKDEGLDTCIIGSFNEKKINALLSLPDNNKIALVVAIGYAKDSDEPKPKKRKERSLTAKALTE